MTAAVLITIVTSLLPWLLGATIALHVTYRASPLPGLAAVAMGIGGFLGYLLLALALRQADLRGISLLSSGFQVSLALVTMALLGLLIPVLRKEPAISVRPGWWLLAICLPWICWLATAHLQTPTQGWDTLQRWGLDASRFLDHATTSSGEPWEQPWKKHPITLYLVMAWSAWAGTWTDAGLGALLPWLMCLASLVLIVAGYAWHCTYSPAATTVAVLYLLSLPLLENHVILAGYGELFLATALAGSSALVAMGIARPSKTLFLLGMLVALSAVFLKNTGAAYALLPIAAWLTVTALARGPWVFMSLLAMVAAGLLAGWHLGIEAELGPVKLAFNPESKVLLFGGRVLELDFPPLTTYLSTEFTSRVVNQSFQLGLLLFVICWFALPQARRTEEGLWKPYLFSLLSCTAVFVLLALSLFTDVALRYATPGADTGHSRFSLPAFVLVPLVLANLFRILTLRARLDEGKRSAPLCDTDNPVAQ